MFNVKDRVKLTEDVKLKSFGGMRTVPKGTTGIIAGTLHAEVERYSVRLDGGSLVMFDTKQLELVDPRPSTGFDLFEIEAMLIAAQMQIDNGLRKEASRNIMAVKMVVQAEMARIGRIRTGNVQHGDERRK